jgi:hypothetical protein
VFSIRAANSWSSWLFKALPELAGANLNGWSCQNRNGGLLSARTAILEQNSIDWESSAVEFGRKVAGSFHASLGLGDLGFHDRLLIGWWDAGFDAQIATDFRGPCDASPRGFFFW